MSEPAEYDLKVDEQANTLLEFDYRLTFFLLTAGAGTVVFATNFAFGRAEKEAVSLSAWILLGIAAVLALASGGFALRAYRYSIQSSRLHLRYRYERKTWSQLREEQQDEWTSLNKKANTSRTLSIRLLVATVAVQIIFYAVALTKEEAMHHYGEDSTTVVAGVDAFYVEIKNKVSGKIITMTIPRVGAGEDPLTEVEEVKVREIANSVAHVLREALE